MISKRYVLIPLLPLFLGMARGGDPAPRPSEGDYPPRAPIETESYTRGPETDEGPGTPTFPLGPAVTPDFVDPAAPLDSGGPAVTPDGGVVLQDSPPSSPQ
jgi:hypothetical protein